MTFNVNIPPQAFEWAWQNRRLVAGSLKAAGVYRHYHDYEDLFQEGLITYAQMLLPVLAQKATRQAIDALAFKKVMWQTLDLLRREKRHYDHTLPLTVLDLADIDSWSSLDWLILQQGLAQMSSIEQTIFYEHLLKQSPLSQLSAECQLSRRTLARAKARLLQQLRQVASAQNGESRHQKTMKRGPKCVK